MYGQTVVDDSGASALVSACMPEPAHGHEYGIIPKIYLKEGTNGINANKLFKNKRYYLKTK